MIRPAQIPDIPLVSQIITDCAERGLMLHRSWSFLYEHTRDFYVAIEDDRVVGVCGLSIVWANLAEVYSLAVVASHRGRGIGKRLVEACVDNAKELAIPRLMTLTYEQAFFSSCGFEVVDRQKLPLKVWSECLRCSRNQACDEIAMVRVLSDVPAPAAPQPATPAEGRYVVPVPLSIQPRRVDRRPVMDPGPNAPDAHRR